MRLVRSTDPQGRGKYALVNLEAFRKRFPVSPDDMGVHPAGKALLTLEANNLLTFGAVGSPDEFFVIKLKDIHAKHALVAYAQSCQMSDPELAEDVLELAGRAGTSHPHCKHPD